MASNVLAGLAGSAARSVPAMVNLMISDSTYTRDLRGNLSHPMDYSPGHPPNYPKSPNCLLACFPANSEIKRRIRYSVVIAGESWAQIGAWVGEYGISLSWPAKFPKWNCLGRAPSDNALKLLSGFPIED